MTEKLLVFIIVISLIFRNAIVADADTKPMKDEKMPMLHAMASVLIDGENGRILYGKNENQKRSIASTTKIMTCIIAMENGNLSDVVEISKKAALMPKVNMRTSTGEKYRLIDLLYAMMLESYNDVAVAIAEHIAGSVEMFAKMMNEKAIQLGAYNTNFVTPNGLDADNHYSTAYDMALIGAFAVKNEELLKIVNTNQYNFEEITGQRKVSVFHLQVKIKALCFCRYYPETH